jgi:hypothetical protein
MSLVKQWMTDILLEITNHEMTKVAKEVYQYEKGIFYLKYLHFRLYIRNFGSEIERLFFETKLRSKNLFFSKLFLNQNQKPKFF